MKLYVITESIPYETYHQFLDVDTCQVKLQNRLAFLMKDDAESGDRPSPETELALWEKDMVANEMKIIRSWEWRQNKWQET
jgi:hypothetical protein